MDAVVCKNIGEIEHSQQNYAAKKHVYRRGKEA